MARLFSQLKPREGLHQNKLIEKYAFTDAFVLHSQALNGLPTEDDKLQVLHSDNIYTDEDQ